MALSIAILDAASRGAPDADLLRMVMCWRVLDAGLMH